MTTFKDIIKYIKKYNNIVIARHLRVDPDALASSLALKSIIQSNYPKKEVYAVGINASKFKYMGVLNKLPENLDNTLLIVLDTPDLKRVDIENFDQFSFTIKIDHHPFVERFCDIEYIDETASSTCEIILDFAYSTKLDINIDAAKLLFQGIVSDTNRFTTINTTYKTFNLVHKLISNTKLDFIPLYNDLYKRPLKEVRIEGYIAQNMTVTENGLGYIKINEDVIKEFGVDAASPGNMINNFNYINEIIVWVFISHDVKNEIYRITMRSRGPVINEIASKYNGGGHALASGARVKTVEEVDNLLKDLDELCKNFRGDELENK